jgi:hypothetical protein
VDEI